MQEGGKEKLKREKNAHIAPHEAGETGMQQTCPSVSLKTEKCLQILLIALISEVFKESTDLLTNWGSTSKKRGKGIFNKPALLGLGNQMGSDEAKSRCCQGNPRAEPASRGIFQPTTSC